MGNTATKSLNKKSWTSYLGEYGAFIALVLLVIVISIISPEFRTTGNFLNLLRQATFNGLIAFGMTCVILSDGMGTGSDAARDSDQAVSILEKFLRSGIEPAISMKILNSVMLLKSAESWGYATVDLMCVNLFTGDTCFYKYGAAPSYVFNGKTVKRIKGESLAAGLGLGEGMAPDLVRMRLKPGCTAIIASDGVIADAEDEWIKALLNKGFEDMKALARSTLKEAEKLYGANDDMTVLTVRVEERP